MLTVGVPVYNGERFLERCLRNLCAEDLDYRIVISDNASTDKTEEIARAFARQDQRIRYIRQESNIGGLANFQYVLDVANTGLFAWRAYDDLSSPGFFKALSAALDAHPTCNLAVGSLQYEPESGKAPPMQRVPAELPADPAQRRKLLMNIAEVTWFYGVFRRAQLRMRYLNARNAYDYVWSVDPLVLLPFLLEGSVITAPDVVFTQYVCDASAASYRPKGVIASSRLVLQFCRHGFAIANEIPAPPIQRIQLYADVIRYTNRYGLKFSRIAKRALFWPYYKLTNRL